jgi:ornithine carbamoyltransferase
VIVIRSNLPAHELDALSSVSGVPIANAMSLTEHPTQALCDLSFLAHRFADLGGRTIAYVGEGNSTAVALAYAAARIDGLRLEVITPPGFELPIEVVARVEELSGQFGGVVTQSTDPESDREADVVYATRWQTTGTKKPLADWRDRFQPFQVNDRLFERLTRGPDAVFMHDLPAHRGEDCSAQLLDGRRSIAFEQAAWKQHAAQAVLEWCLG